MDISLKWLNQLLDRPVTADEADAALTAAGFPIESRTERPGGDIMLDVEVTSNRGDCLSHLGCAREVAAVTGRRLKVRDLPEPPRSKERASGIFTLENRIPQDCPTFTVHIIRGARVGQSPAWLCELLEAVDQRPISNAVDVTNWLTLEIGNPAHVFDLKKLAGSKLIVRHADGGEKLNTLDDKQRTLAAGEMVIYDGQRPQSLAGVIGGADSEVDESTTDIVLEVATWNPAMVRSAARRLNIRTDASHRFERIVHPATCLPAARLAAAMLCELTGGTLLEGEIVAGAPIPEPAPIRLRPARARAMIGVDIPATEMNELLESHEIAVRAEGEDLLCTPPAHRPDLVREIDLIEEVARTKGFDAIPVHDRMLVRIGHPQESERAAREMARVLTGLGFHETVTFSFVTPEQAQMFMPPGLEAVGVDDERRGGEPTLRPSAIASLLRCRKANLDAQSEQPGGLRLYEIAAAYAQVAGREETVEHRNLSLLMDVPGVAPGKQAKQEQLQQAVRLLRGSIEALATALAGPAAAVEVTPCAPSSPAWADGAHGQVTLDGRHIGVLGVIGPQALRLFDLDIPVVCADLSVEALCAAFPPKALAHALPAFPGIERDLSLIVDEQMAWADVASAVRDTPLEQLEDFEFVGTYRGAQVGARRKSVTLRLRFRDPARTLRHEEVDPQIEALVTRLGERLGATLRA
ncbi:MAG: phenylalanine--tRNA ligase subunit beta [Phycisphaerales bacterium JB039]